MGMWARDANGLLLSYSLFFCCSKSLLCSLLLDTLRFISSSAGPDRTDGRPHDQGKGHQVWLLEFCRPWLLGMGLVYTLLEYCTINISKDSPASRVIPYTLKVILT